MAALKQRHEGEVTGLQAQLADLEQQLTDARDGSSSSQHSGSVNLPESERLSDASNTLQTRLDAALRDKKKAEDARIHLESTLDELQREVEHLQAKNEALEQEVAAKVKDFESAQQEVVRLRAELQKQVSESLQAVQSEQEEAMANAEGALEKLGDVDGAKNLSKELLSTLERENLVLKEQVLHLQEQKALLEKAAFTSHLEKVAQQKSHAAQRVKLRAGNDEEDSSDGTVGTELSSEANSETYITQEQIDEELVSLRQQLTKQAAELSQAEMERADWEMERDALEHVVTELRAKTQEQEEEITSLKSVSGTSLNIEASRSPAQNSGSDHESLKAELASLREEKVELEGAIEELDSQHSQALEQLIGQRDTLQAKLAESTAQVQSQGARVEELNALVLSLREEVEKSTESVNKSPVKDAEISDLKEKLQKGGLVINDLHMDKQELEEELRAAREEVTLKVAKVKDAREEAARVVAEKKTLEERLQATEARLQEAEEELEKWEARNEERQLEQMRAASQGECARLRAQVQALEQEKQDFTQKLLLGLSGQGAQGVAVDASSVSDPALRSVLEGEARVRRRMEEDQGMIEELRQQVQKLYDSKQALKRELAELQAFKETTIEKLVDVEGELQDARTHLETAVAEKQGLVEKVSRAEGAVKELKAELAEKELENKRVGEQCEKLADQLTSQKKHYDAYVQELKQAQEMGAESIQAEHQQLLDSQRNLKMELDKLKTAEREKLELEEQLKAKAEENAGWAKKAGTLGQELSSVLEQISKLEEACEQKDRHVEELQQRMAQFDTDLNEMEESVSLAEEKHKQEVSEKVRSLEEVKAHRDGLERSLSQVSLELQQTVQAKNVLERSLSSQDIVGLSFLSKTDQASNHTEGLDDLDSLRNGGGSEAENEVVSKLETELILRNSVIERLEGEVSAAQDMVRRQEMGITELNEKTAETKRLLEKAEEQAVRQQSSMAVMRQASIDRERLLEEIQSKLNILAPTLSEQQIQKLQNSVGATVVPALEYQGVKAIEFGGKSLGASDNTVMQHPGENNSLVIEELSESSTATGGEETSENRDREMRLLLEKDTATLRERLKEKDAVVEELQKSNTSLLLLLEQRSGGQGLVDQVSGHRMEAELQGLRAEKEQMVAVMTEKTRENSSLRSEVHRLMEVVAAGQAALTKLQDDNQSLEQQRQQRQHRSPAREEEEEDDMRREALANMARLVRDRETEIEALTQKNETLLAVLQGGGGEPQSAGAGAQVAALLQEKDQLSQQVAVMVSEREQLVACVTQKHSEAVAYHGEAQRLTGVLAEVTALREKTEAEYGALVKSFEDKSQALVSVQSELIQSKQKLSDLEVRHGELIQRSSSQDNSAHSKGGVSPSPQLAALEEELSRLRSSESQLSTLMSQKEEKVHFLSQRVSSLEESLMQKDTECAHLRKQVENTKFQLTGLMSEIADVRSERDGLQRRMTHQDSESAGLREQFSRMSAESRDKDAELSSLREQVSTLTGLVGQNKSNGGGDGEQGERLSRLVRENESLAAQALQLQRERDHQASQVEQLGHDCLKLQEQIAQWKEKEFKLNKELQRLRQHLIEIEDGYTQEALESEEREKKLRNRLAMAEEQLSSSSSHIEQTRLESGRLVETLQHQLQEACAQRDAAYSQVTAGQDQTRQLSQSLANLQLVLEQFQRDKDSAIAGETERLEGICRRLRDENAAQKRELEDTRGDLSDALEGLEAANRLSEQLDRKEEALAALKEEVQLRELALHDAEEEIRKLNSSTEAKVDKTLLHNMVMTWLTSPESKRPEIVQLIGNILSFSPDDFKKIDAAHNHGGLLSGIFRRPSAAAAGSTHATPSKSAGNNSFSQLFVNFLERESSPPPTPVRLPAEAMAAEAQNRQRPPTFNPFTAPRHVTNDTFGAAGRFGDGFGGRNSASLSSSQPHLLMAPDSPSSALFTPVFSTSAARSSESAILKGVLGESR